MTRSAGSSTASRRHFRNDHFLELANRQATIVLDSAGCDVQRDYAASLWLRWNDMGVGPGAGVTVKSYTGRVLASAEQGFGGPRFHC